MDLIQLLEDFDDIIIERGINYYGQGRVTDLEEVASGEFEAIVEGSEDYNVTVTLGDDGEADYDCDCPYWGAPHCKHVVAVLYAIEAYLAKRPSTAAKRKFPTELLSAESLRSLPQERLISLIRALATKYPDAKAWLAAQLSPPEDALENYRRLIRKALAKYTVQGYVDSRHADAALSGFDDAQTYFFDMVDVMDIPQALDFFFMIMEEAMECSDCFDDAEVYEFIQRDFDCLAHLIDTRVLTAEAGVKKDCYQRLMEAARGSLFEGWIDLKEDLIDLCAQIADKLPELRASVLEAHETAISNRNESDYSLDNKQKAHIDLLTRWEGKEQAQSYVAQHVAHEYCGRMLFDLHLKNKEYDAALELCVDNGRMEMPIWQERCYRVYELMGDTKAQKQLGEQLLFLGNEQYYDKLKQLYTAAQWPQKRDELLDMPLDTTIYINIIKKEKDKPRMLAFIRKHPESISRFYQYVHPEYDKEVRMIFEDMLRSKATHAKSRSAYRDIRHGIADYQKACGAEAAQAFIDELRRLYPRKRALQEELDEAL